MAQTIAAQSANLLPRSIIVIGGSNGSLAPLLRILRDLEKGLRASVFIVQHRMASAPPPLVSLSSSTALPVRVAEHGSAIEPGIVSVAPGGHHLLLTTESIRVAAGPRENLARPSIDVLFRSAAVAFGPRVVGVILSGELHDGAAGLAAIRRCGGFTIVQDPADAVSGDLPRAALQSTPNRTLSAGEIGPLLNELMREKVPADFEVPRDLALEARAAAVAMTDPGELSRVGEASHFTCPECQGPLWLMHEHPSHFRCDVGHAFSDDDLNLGQAQALERALWLAYRILAERARLLERMAQNAQERGTPQIASDYTKKMHELHRHSRAILAALEAIEPAATQGGRETPA